VNPVCAPLIGTFGVLYEGHQSWGSGAKGTHPSIGPKMILLQHGIKSQMQELYDVNHMDGCARLLSTA